MNPQPISLEQMLRKFFERGGEAAARRDAASLHAFRIAAKHLRYSLEMLEPEGSEPLITRLREIQRRLGAMNDAVVAAHLLEQCPYLSPRAKVIPAKLDALAQSHIDAFQRYWCKGFPESEQRRWIIWATATE